MNREKQFIGFIPARGGSKSIPLKNIKKFNKRPLIYWVIDAALKCRYLDRVIVSTDSQLIAQTVEKYNLDGEKPRKLRCVGRSRETATDVAATELAMLEYSRNHLFGHIALIQATSPLLNSGDLEKGIETYFAGRYDSLLSLVRQKRFVWQENGSIVLPQNYDPRKRPCRQDFAGILLENGAFYITGREQLLKTEARISGRIGYYEMDQDTYYELDEPADWGIMEGLQKSGCGLPAGGRRLQIKLLAMDCDGVLTDGGMYYTESGDEMKKFNAQDGMGVELLRKAGIKTAIISGEKTSLIEKRAHKLGIDYVYTGIKNKVAAMQDILLHTGLTLAQTAYIGDDINDADLLALVGLSFAVNNARREIKEIADYVTKAQGGQGAVRETAEIIINSNG